jgi:class 3 adenylate cyclase
VQLANTLDTKRPFAGQGPAGIERVDVAFLCADVVGFTEMTRRLGDDVALRVMRRVAGSVRREAAPLGGEVLEIRGDGFLLAFAAPQAALRCAFGLLRALELDRAAHAGESVRLRQAVHSGSAVRDASGYFGRDLILTYRLLSQAGVGRIAVTPQAACGLPGRWRERAVGTGRFQPKGFEDEIEFVEFDAAPERMRVSMLVPAAQLAQPA